MVSVLLYVLFVGMCLGAVNVRGGVVWACVSGMGCWWGMLCFGVTGVGGKGCEPLVLLDAYGISMMYVGYCVLVT